MELSIAQLGVEIVTVFEAGWLAHKFFMGRAERLNKSSRKWRKNYEEEVMQRNRYQRLFKSAFADAEELRRKCMQCTKPKA